MQMTKGERARVSHELQVIVFLKSDVDGNKFKAIFKKILDSRMGLKSLKLMWYGIENDLGGAMMERMIIAIYI